MYNTETLTLVIAATSLICFASLLTEILVAHQLFGALDKKYNAYYKSLGKPLVLAPLDVTFEGYRQLMRSNIFLYSLAFKGIPKKFPKDIALMRLARIIRATFVIGMVLFVVLIIIFSFFYKY